MKAFFPLLLVGSLLAVSTTGCMQDEHPSAYKPSKSPRPSKRAFDHRAGADKGRNNKAQFRHDNKPPLIDLSPHNPGKTKSVKAPKPYKYSKG